MARKVIPFIKHTDVETGKTGLFHNPTLRIVDLFTPDGERFNNEAEIEPGDKFCINYWGHKQNGVFFDAKKVFTTELTMAGFCDPAKNSIRLKDSDSDTYYVMYPSEFLDMARKTVIERGVVRGNFKFVGKSSATSIAYVG